MKIREEKLRRVIREALIQELFGFGGSKKPKGDFARRGDGFVKWSKLSDEEKSEYKLGKKAHGDDVTEKEAKGESPAYKAGWGDAQRKLAHAQ